MDNYRYQSIKFLAITTTSFFSQKSWNNIDILIKLSTLARGGSNQ